MEHGRTSEKCDSLSQSETASVAFTPDASLVSVNKAEFRTFGPVAFVNFELVTQSTIPAGVVTLGTVEAAYAAEQVEALPTYATNGLLSYIVGRSVRANVVQSIAAGRTLYFAGCYPVA